MAGNGITIPAHLYLKIAAESLAKLKKDLQDTLSEATATLGLAKEEGNAPKDPLSESRKEMLGFMKELSNDFKNIGRAVLNVVQTSLGFVEDIYKQMRKASPLLETIESMFNLAITLFFMPLGNKLAEVMLPAMIDLLDAVVDIWDKFGDKPLGEMMTIAVTEGVKIIASYLLNLGSLLSEQGGIIGSIGRFLQQIGGFIKEHGANLLNIVGNILTFIFDRLAFFIGAAVGFFTTSLALQSLTYLATLASAGWKGLIAAAIGVGSGISAGAYMSNYSSDISTSEITPVSPDTGEYQIAQVNSGRTNIVNNFTFEGLTNDELKYIIKDEVSGMISQSKYRGGY